MKHSFILFIIFCLTLFNLSAQNNSAGLFTSINATEWELVTYGRKKQLLGKTINYFKFTDTTNENRGGIVYSTIYDMDGKKLTQYHYTVISTYGDLKIGMISTMAEDQHIYYAKFDLVPYIDEPLFIPADPKVGQTLSSAKLGLNVMNKKSGDLQETLVLDGTERVVIAKETVTVPAGTFDCYKIRTIMQSHAVVLGVSFKYSFTIYEWYAHGVGVVKSEAYDKKGELACYSLLSKHTSVLSK